MKKSIKSVTWVIVLALFFLMPAGAACQGMPVYDNTNFISFAKSLVESAKQTSQLLKTVQFLKTQKEKQMKKRLIATSLITASLILSACTSTYQKMLDAGATRLNDKQVKTHLVNRTERWSKGGGYYQADSKIDIVWKGSDYRGEWQVSDDGEVCVMVPTWDKFCHHYLNDNGSITMMYEGKPTVKEMFKGNQLSTL